MVLVCDSGSSKADWILAVSDDKRVEFRTKGINPFFKNEREIIKILQQSKDVKEYGDKVCEIYFYGAGCSSPDKREVVSNALSQLFKNAFISVDNDLMGSIYATCGNKEGLSCILGTGSNISYFDGQKVFAGKHGLGYILGDEGSGTWFGKRLITSYLYGSMPADLREKFNVAYPISKEDVIQHVYGQSAPNYYLASFAQFLSAEREHPFIQNLVLNGFEEFVTTNILSYPEYKVVPTHFVGSIAFHLQDELLSVCQRHNVKVGKIVKHPVQELFEFIKSGSFNP